MRIPGPNGENERRCLSVLFDQAFPHVLGQEVLSRTELFLNIRGPCRCSSVGRAAHS